MPSRTTFALCLIVMAAVCRPSPVSAQVEWTRFGDGPVLERGAPGSWDARGAGNNFVLDDVSELKLWYVSYVGPSYQPQIGLATSTDGLEWEKEASNPVVPGIPGTWQASVNSFSVLRGADGAYTMWHDAWGSGDNFIPIGRATSTDGITWVFGDSPVLAPTAVWEGMHLFMPRVVFDGATYHMWYTGGFTNNSLAIGYATSADGIVWKKYAGNPVINAATDSSFGAFAGSVTFDPRTSTYEMWYSSARSSQALAGWATSYATSADGVTWCLYGEPVLAPEGGWDLSFSLNPSVLSDGKSYRMWYTGGSSVQDDGTGAIGLATAEWTIPKASFTAAAGAGGEDSAVDFDASRSLSPNGAIAGHEWDFGDGSPPVSSGASPLASHRYARPGHYPVKLTASDGAGERGSVARGANARLGCADVSPWLSADIGEPLYPGSACLEEGGAAGEGAGDDLRIAAGGRLLAGTSDELHFVYQPLAGDGAVTARIAEAGGAGDRFQVGVMIREGLDAAARQLAAVLHKAPAAAARLRAFRRIRSSSGTSSDSGEFTEAPDAWVRVERSGDELIASASRLGPEGPWTELRRVTLEDLGAEGEVLAGIVALGHDQRSGSDGGRFDALLARVSGASVIPAEPKKPGLGPFLRGDCNGDGQVAGSVTDAVFLLNHNFSGGSAPPCLAACDANGDGQVTGQVTDAVFLLQFNFLGGPPPAAPFPECAASRRSEDERLGCAESPASCR